MKALGKNPSGAHLSKIEHSENYQQGSFQNLSHTPALAEDASYCQMIKDYFNKSDRTKPDKPIPTVITNLLELDAEKIQVVWFGHSSYLIKTPNHTILVDPVLSGNASPVAPFIPAFDGSDVYKAEMMPPIDVLLLTHDHYDHMDYKTLIKLRKNVKQVCTSLGVGAHLTYWGYEQNQITELDWWEHHRIAEGLEIVAAPGRHFSGRGIKRGKTLWSSFLLKIGEHKIFIGGDSGYDTHFAEIGKRLGPFDIAFLECGQYGENWPHIHMTPEQTVQAAIDLQTPVLYPVHWAKFSLAYHDWDEPIKRLKAEAEKKQVFVTTPQIGEVVVLNEHYPQSRWWEQL